MRKHKSIDSFLQHYNKKYRQGGTFSKQQMFGIPYGYQDPTQEESGIYNDQTQYLGDEYLPINKPQADFQGSPNIVSQSLDPGSTLNQDLNSIQSPTTTTSSRQSKGPALGMAAGAAAMKAVGGLFNGAISMIPALQALIPEQEDERSIRPPERRAYNQFSQGQPGVYQDGGNLPYQTTQGSKFRVDYDWGSVAPITEPIQEITPIQQPSVAFDNYVTNPIERVTQTTYDQSWNPINTERIPQPQREVFVPNYSDNRYNIDRELSELYPSNQYLIGDAYQPVAPQRRNLLQRLFKAQEGAIIPDPTIILDDNGIPIEVPYITAESGIHIKPENRGKFTAKANSAGKGVQEYARQVLANKENYPPSTVKQAQFARNSSKWDKAESGYTVGGEYELSQQEIDYLIQQGYELEY